MPILSATPSPTARHPSGLGPFLLVAGAIAMGHILLHLAAASVGYDHIGTKSGVAQVLAIGKLIVSPALVLTALYLAVKERVRGAIVALATLMLVTWLNELPKFSLDEIDPSIVVFVLFPVVAGVAVWLAYRGRALWVAGLLVGIPAILWG